MSSNAIGSEVIISACEHASIRLEGDKHGRDLGPCKRCCGVHPKKLVAITGLFHEECDDRERVFTFPRCSTFVCQHAHRSLTLHTRRYSRVQ
eukprot:m51a1_g12099 hypothetical protein (92) ;mRNA; f:1486-1873